MSNQVKDGGPAFPVSEEAIMRNAVGMTLRDYFAAKALQGFCSNPNAHNNPKACAEWLRDHGATSAYQMADAMLEAREQA